jgi:hypothetical protein
VNALRGAESSMSWYCVQLTSAQVAAGDAQRIHKKFETLFHIARAPTDTAMLTDTLAVQDLITLYFYLPAADFAEAFIRSVNAKPCERPPSDVALSVGHNDVRERLRRGEI